MAANNPAYGYTWTGVAQSFTAQDSHVLFGFYVFNVTQSAVSDPLLFSLYSGDGQFTNLLGQATATVNLAMSATDLAQVNFSSISLTPGSQYTVVASLPSQGLPPAGTNSNLAIWYNSLSNSYAGGRFYATGVSFDQSRPVYADRDFAFKVTPISTPEPGSMYLLGSGILGLGVVARRRVRRS